MTLAEAITARHSVRRYLEKPLSDEVREALQEEINACNEEGGLHIQLVTDEPKAFSGFLAKYGRFSGVGNYIAMIAPKGKDVELGYYGEQVVLLAQTLGLNTCWVGLTFKKQPDQYEIRDGEVLNSLIALGYGATQGTQHPQKKTIEDVAEWSKAESPKLKEESNFPDWFVHGVEAALLAPTAINQQKFLFVLHDNNRVEAKSRIVLLNDYAQTDLGIAKCHFELGAGKENFEWV